MLGALRLANIPISVLRQGQWGKTKLPMARDPYGKTLGILGMGSIGRNFAAKARAFGMKIQYHNRTRLSPDLEAGAEYVDFKTLLATSDVLSLNLSLSKATEHIIGKEELAAMKHGITIVNTARGKLIDEAALVDALNDGDRIWSVGLDVFEEEPKVHPGLIECERVFLLPHIGTMTKETRVSVPQAHMIGEDADRVMVTAIHGAACSGQLEERGARGQAAYSHQLAGRGLIGLDLDPTCTRASSSRRAMEAHTPLSFSRESGI